MSRERSGGGESRRAARRGRGAPCGAPRMRKGEGNGAGSSGRRSAPRKKATRPEDAARNQVSGTRPARSCRLPHPNPRRTIPRIRAVMLNGWSNPGASFSGSFELVAKQEVTSETHEVKAVRLSAGGDSWNHTHEVVSPTLEYGAGDLTADESLTRSTLDCYSRRGAVAQLGERVNGIHEVAGSIPASSTIVPLAILVTAFLSCRRDRSVSS
jgi:hypothetical protein